MCRTTGPDWNAIIFLLIRLQTRREQVRLNSRVWIPPRLAVWATITLGDIDYRSSRSPPAQQRQISRGSLRQAVPQPVVLSQC